PLFGNALRIPYWRKALRQTERAYGIIRRKPLKEKVPKRGLEPPLPLREPGPEPGASASSATSADILVAFQSNTNRRFPSRLRSFGHPFTSRSRMGDIANAGHVLVISPLR